jgi:hypothetical protein
MEGIHVKLRDVLTAEELEEIKSLENRMFQAETRKEINYYQSKIEELMVLAKQRYIASLESNASKSEQAVSKEMFVY